MRLNGPKDAAPVQTREIRVSRIPGSSKGASDPVPSFSIPERVRGEGGTGDGLAVSGVRAGKHVYRVGEFRIPVKDSARGLKSRGAERVKDLLRKRAKSPVAGHHDPTVIEPLIRKLQVPERPVSHAPSSSHVPSPSQHDPHRSLGRFRVNDAEDRDDDD